jgi:hypothetical protein
MSRFPYRLASLMSTHVTIPAIRGPGVSSTLATPCLPVEM